MTHFVNPQRYIQGEIILTWHGTIYVIDPDTGLPGDPVEFDVNSLPESDPGNLDVAQLRSNYLAGSPQADFVISSVVFDAPTTTIRFYPYDEDA